ncbi:sensor histidine kinase [Cumulibacter manganitolerans]|uniref:sensor histidine kinase n=1 Tax=Cumulibacter manganitolerans TaxID=1884992 RepID=UPI001296776B|nr:histidine kinase [Cumulibacter manganitolerans]
MTTVPRISPVAVDLCVAAVLAAVLLPSGWRMAGSLGGGASAWALAALVTLHLLPPAGRRAPEATFAVACAAAAVLALLPVSRYQGQPVPMVLAPSMICFFVALYWCARERSAAVGRVALAVALVGGAGVLARLVLTDGWWGELPVDAAGWVLLALVPSAGSVAAWAIGRLHRRALDDRAAALTRAAEDERARIAGDMHDVVSHSLAVIVAQAEGGRMTTPDRSAREVLQVIGDTGRAALADMRSMLGVLRETPASRADPQPGVPDLRALAERSGASFTESGHARAIPAGVGLAAYRITQEALTNALKHGVGPATVRLSWEAGLSITVANPAAATGGDGSGSGLQSMRQRAESVGGTVEAGRRGTEWVVRAVLPVRGR